MGIFLIVVGLVWAALGFGNIVLGLGNIGLGTSGFSSVEATALLMNNMVFFVLPGLGVAGLGEMIRRKVAEPSRGSVSDLPGGGDSAKLCKCPYCAEMIRCDAIRCRYCQSDVELSDPQVRNSDEPPSVALRDSVLKGVVRCPACDQLVSDRNARKLVSPSCPACGQKFILPQESASGGSMTSGIVFRSIACLRAAYAKAFLPPADSSN